MHAPTPWTRPSPLPSPVVTTERLVVRWYEEADARALHEAVEASRDVLYPWLPWAQNDHRNVRESRQRIADFAADRSSRNCTNFVMALFDRTNGELLGGTGYHLIDPNAHKSDIGYWVRTDRQRQGLCAEAVAALITAGFSSWGFRRIRIQCAEANVSSVKVIEKLRLRLEGRELEERWVNSHGWVDGLTYGVLRDEWNADAGHGPG